MNEPREKALKVLADGVVQSCRDFVARAIHPLAAKMDSTDALLVDAIARIEHLEARLAEAEAQKTLRRVA